MSKPTDIPPLKIVLDSNVYIAAALNPDGLMYRIVLDSAAQKLAIYTASEEILLEIQNKLETKLLFERSEIIPWLGQLRQVVQIVYPTQSLRVVERDPDDNKILECAVEAAADLIITADKDLLVLKIYVGIKIIHPNSFKYVFPSLRH